MKKALSLVLVLLSVLSVPLASTAVDSIEIPAPPPEIEEIIEELQTIYRLRIRYIYPDGSPAAPAYLNQLDVGTPFDVPSPEITGYIPTVIAARGVMPARDMEYTVIYIPNIVPEEEEGDDPSKPGKGGPSYFTIEDYETPLGFGASMMNLGICIE